MKLRARTALPVWRASSAAASPSLWSSVASRTEGKTVGAELHVEQRGELVPQQSRQDGARVEGDTAGSRTRKSPKSATCRQDGWVA